MHSRASLPFTGVGAWRTTHFARVVQLSCPLQQKPVALRFFSWNCSGLTQLLFEELKLYLRLNPDIQVIFLQETHRFFVLLIRPIKGVS